MAEPVPSYLHDVASAYDDVAARYSELFATVLDRQPLERALLAAFADLVRDLGGPVADLGCGPGHVTAHLRELGLDVFGVDVSPAMVTLARGAYPQLRFDEGTMTALDLPDRSLGGVLARYSLIHTPPGDVPAVLAEVHRVLAPGGYLLLGFLATDDPATEVHAYDHRVSVAYRWPPDQLATLLSKAGLVEAARLVRAPVEEERGRQAQLLARRPPEG
ncbi:methyltransferase domain-containing protein [Frankia sp. CNm7]|uniref:Methyltransferase domain-containing protein n=1 Tax=Frankia nepalensis TaxID=1836974 RepID=A0A937RLY8_9ACTN|nr:class I SAM-dependent methyltransferase [Frankia nepalensis]MBL7501688.1 methyltransferase domain-containing protein [Frankia nepalensis]MBL7513447.1 methyltransferase domain-containing protein [Frankia nepalensis]MBL7520836.1 methyltransferase domain-containing protein [Frankia nepalensis]MBL7632557.1 methyltransferase domain-containing protein [Frankia nepalensis]